MEKHNQTNPDEQASEQDVAATLAKVYRALNGKGYDPINQIIGYLLSEDPTYITNYGGARAMIGKIDRDDLLDEIVRFYFEQKKLG